ncbi:MAG: hypothetical protein ABIG34_03455 [Candidatus Peregrinibacteria bacterium]
MELDPHTLQQILLRIRQQMRCPQCGKQVPVDFGAVRVVSENAMLLQLKCDMCNAFIVLHASLQGVEKLGAEPIASDARQNVSSSLKLSDHEMAMLHEALDQSDGSFENLFKKFGTEQDLSADLSAEDSAKGGAQRAKGEGSTGTDIA